MKSIKGLILVLVLVLILPCSTIAYANAKNSPAIQYLGHSAFVISDGSGTSIGIDMWTKDAFPYASDVPKNLISNSDKPFTYLLRSHMHPDHSYIPDKVTLVKDLEDYTPKAFGGITVTQLPTEHFGDKVPSGQNNLNNAYLIEVNKIRILDLADAFGTMFDEKKLAELKKKAGDIDILLLPIGDAYGNDICFKEALGAIIALNPKVIVPIHYWSPNAKQAFIDNAERMGGKIERIKSNLKLLDKKDIVSDMIWDLTPGEYKANK